MSATRPSGPPIRIGAALVWRGPADGPAGDVEVALIADGSAWTLPYAVAAPGEPEAAITAATPVAGPGAVLGPLLGVVRDTVAQDERTRLRLRTVWAVESTGAAGDNITARWLPLAEATAALAGDPLAEAVGRLGAGPRRVTRLLLLRHADALPAREGPDSERRLSSAGQAQADALPRTLAPFGPVSLACSPARRCRETVAPAAAALGLPVEVESFLAEHAAERRAAEDYLRGRATAAGTGGAAVVCSHSPAVADALERLTRHHPELLPRPARLDPAGVWSIEFAGETPRVLQYLPPPAARETA
jgi:phosphohistidine phosphatase SixA